MKKIGKWTYFHITGAMLATVLLFVIGIVQLNQNSVSVINNNNDNNAPSNIFSVNNKENNSEAENPSNEQNMWVLSASNTSDNYEVSTSSTDTNFEKGDSGRYAKLLQDDEAALLKSPKYTAGDFKNGTTIYWQLDGSELTIGNSDAGLSNSFDSKSPAPWVDENQYKIHSVNIVNKIQPTATIGWFGCQTSLDTADVVRLSDISTITGLDNIDMSQVTDATCMFCGSDLLTSCEASSAFFDSIKQINIAEGMCNYTNLDNSFLNNIALAIAPTAKNARFAFANNFSNLTTFDLGSEIEMSLSNARSMFIHDTALAFVKAKALISEGSETKDIENMFKGCANLLKISLDEDTNWSKIPNISTATSLFKGCTNLTGQEGTSQTNGGGTGIKFAKTDRAMSENSPGYFSNFKATKKITVEFTNNYTDDRVKKSLSEPFVKVVNVNEPFTFETGIDASQGAPTIIYDPKSGITYDINPTTNAISFSSEIGITSDCTIVAKYGPPICIYHVHRFYETANGEWTYWEGAESPDETYFYSAVEGATVPTNEDTVDGLYGSEEKGIANRSTTHEYDAIAQTTANADGTAIASLYYRRKMMTVTFDTNGGLGGPGGHALRNGAIVPNSTIEPTRSGYTFAGWYTQAEGGSKVEIPQSGFVVPAEDTILYAHWNPPTTDRYMTIVYWGENAERNGQDTSTDVYEEDYSYLSECYVKGAFEDTFDVRNQKWADYINPYKGQQGSSTNPLTKIQYIDADNTGSANVPIGDCYYATLSGAYAAHVDDPVVFQADNYAVYNVYLKRVVYTWEFYEPGFLWIGQDICGSITARWNQNVLEQFKNICRDQYDEDFAPWEIEKDTYISLLTNMPRKDRKGEYDDNGSGGLYEADNDGDKIELRYCIQAVDAPGDDHPNIQSANYLNENYEEFAVYKIQTFIDGIFSDDDLVFSEEELINIEGFITPSPGSRSSNTLPYYSDATACFALDGSENIGYDQTDAYKGWSIYYKRAKHGLTLNVIKPDSSSNAGTYSSYRTIEGVDYEKTIGDVLVPNDVPGRFVKDGQPTSERKLKYFIPENPGYGSLDPNYVFDGWALNNAVGSQEIDLNDTYMPNAEYNIYAKWKAPEVNVTFNQVRAPKTEDVVSHVDYTGTYNQKLGYSGPTPTTFPKHYFEYWYYHDTDAQGNDKVVYFNPDAMLLPDKDIVLYPEYSCNEMQVEYSVSVDNNSAMYHGRVESSVNPIYAIEDTAIEKTAQNNVLKIYASNFTYETITATGITDTTGKYDFDKWQINTGAGWQDLSNEQKLKGNVVIRALFKTSSEQAQVTSPPTAKPNLKYTGAPQAIANEGTAGPNASMMYCVTQSEDLPSLSSYKTTIDQATYAGNYYVYYFAKASDGKYDSAVERIQVEIAKAPLNISIKFLEREKWYSGFQQTIRDKECYEAICDNASFDPQKVNTEALLYVTGKNEGSYFGPTLAETSFVYVDENYYGEFTLFNDGKTVVEKPKMTIFVNPIKKTPAVKASQQYTGKALTLLSSGAIAIEKCNVYYAYTNDPETQPADANWKAVYNDVRATNAGTYYIWLKVFNADGQSQVIKLDTPAVIYT